MDYMKKELVSMLYKIKRWIRTKIFKTPYIVGVDVGNGKDQSCEVYSYIDEDGKQTIINVRHFK